MFSLECVDESTMMVIGENDWLPMA